MKKALAPRSFSEVGFTLIEILVVTTIIVLLTSVAAVSYSQFSKSSRDARRKIDLEQVKAALEMYRSNDASSSYPVGTWSSLSVLTTTYIQSLPTDPKDSLYDYYYSGTANNYTIGAYLEAVTGASCGAANGCTVDCNYCLGPYGKL